MSLRPPPKISLRPDWTKEKGKFYWALKIDSQKEKLLDSHKKKLLDKQNSSNQPNQYQVQIVIDQGNLISRKT